MAVAFTLGYTPLKFKLELSAGADFVAAVRRTDGADWPSDTDVWLDFGSTQWHATVAGPAVQWDESSTDVDALLAASPTAVTLWYTQGGGKVKWATGTVARA